MKCIVGGMSSSLPEDVQYEMYHTVPGLEHAKIVRNAYAIEYDCINPNQLLPTLEFKNIKGLFSGGQFNGSSGYEEAAAQGIVAGINAALYVKEKEQLVLHRSESYIGVLIDDLVTKENHEPYRMMTSVLSIVYYCVRIMQTFVLVNMVIRLDSFLRKDMTG